MKLIVGLGNPGKEYDNTRHNLGFKIIDNYFPGNNLKEKFNSLYYETTISNEKIIFIKPLTFMNLSGKSVKEWVNYYDILLKNVLVIHDDLDLNFKKYKVKYDSSSGGNNGIKSIIDELDSQQFCQFKIGIKNDLKIDAKDFVLSRFNEEELEYLNSNMNQYVDVIDYFITNGIDKTMWFYNKK